MEYTVSYLNKVPIIKDNVIITPIGEDSVIYPSFEDEVDLPYVITLNEIGTFILNNINGENNLGNILENILNNYNVLSKSAYDDLNELVEDLIQEKIIIWKK